MIAARSAGGLIGSGGGVIKLCSAQHNTSVTLSRRDEIGFPGSDGARRVCVRGATVDACVATHGLLITLLAGLHADAQRRGRLQQQQEGQRRPRGAGERTSPETIVNRAVAARDALLAGGAIDPSDEWTAAIAGAPAAEHTMLVPRSMAGAVIGPGGSRVRQICAESGAFVRLLDAPDDVSPRPITIVGRAREILLAAQLIGTAMWAPRRDGSPAPGFLRSSSCTSRRRRSSNGGGLRGGGGGGGVDVRSSRGGTAAVPSTAAVELTSTATGGVLRHGAESYDFEAGGGEGGEHALFIIFLNMTEYFTNVMLLLLMDFFLSQKLLGCRFGTTTWSGPCWRR